MSCSCAACRDALTVDPWKRVYYAHGLVLGVEEFTQEEFRFLEAERRQNRALHGYGTVCGLDVRVRDTTGEPEVYVAPGLALDPRGRWIHVPEARCASLNEWLSRHPEAGGGSTGEVSLALRLCYRECATDLVPIPGGPCRTADESMSASRVSETFTLDLTPDAPDAAEWETVRAFARLLGLLRVGVVSSPEIGIDEFLQRVRDLAPGGVSPPFPGSPAFPPEEQIDIPEDLVRLYLDAAFRVWTTEVRPAILPGGRNCSGGPPEEGCVLLARLTIPTAMSGTGPMVDGGAAAVTIDETERPVLLQTQLLQEMLAEGAAVGSGAGGDMLHSMLLGLDQDDHSQYLLVQDREGGAAEDLLLRNLSGGGTARITDLPVATAGGEAMPHGQTAAGDLSQSYPAPRVVALQGLSVPQPTPSDGGRFLRVQPGAAGWELANAPSDGGDDGEEEDLVRIFATSWRHNRPTDFRFVLNGEEFFGVAVAFGRREAGDAEVLIGADWAANPPQLELGSLDVNTFRVFLEWPASNLSNDSQRFLSARQRLRLVPLTLVPIAPRLEEEDFFREGELLANRVEGGFRAPAALLAFGPEWLRAFAESQGSRIDVEIEGDHVLAFEPDGDEARRAIDAEFLRSRLPTGDRGEGQRRGRQGGRFLSWTRFAGDGDDDDGDLDINAADVPTLVERGGLTPPQAKALVRARERAGGFGGENELRSVNGLSDAAVNRLLNNGGFVGPRLG